MKLPVVKLDAKKAGEIELADAVFGIEEIRSDILQRMVRYQLSKRQAGTHSTQNRDDVSRTTKKLYRQKGTGGARHGSRNAPIFVGGGVAHGPHPHSHAHGLPKKVRALASMARRPRIWSLNSRRSTSRTPCSSAALK